MKRKGIIPRLELLRLCKKNGWLKDATATQVDRIFIINEKYREYNTKTLAVAIWVLTPNVRVFDIRCEIARVVNKYYPVSEQALIKTAKRHFACRNGISPDSVFCEPAGLSKDGYKLFHVKYLDQDKVIENSGDWLTTLTITAREDRL